MTKYKLWTKRHLQNNDIFNSKPMTNPTLCLFLKFLYTNDTTDKSQLFYLGLLENIKIKKYSNREDPRASKTDSNRQCLNIGSQNTYLCIFSWENNFGDNSETAQIIFAAISF